MLHAFAWPVSAILLTTAIAFPSVRPSTQPATQAAQAPSAARESVPGATNYARIDAVVACGGATTAEALNELRRMGFRAVLNARLESEPSADVRQEGETVRSLGMTYLHIPFSADSPSSDAIDQFLEAVGNPAHHPIYMHCSTGNRVSALWFVKRVLRDGWPQDKAMAEAEAIGLTRPSLRDFVVQYVKDKVK
jgi:uncharacterized protein (TIGR01244 family)